MCADCEGHGTHVAAAVGGLTFGVAPGAKLHAVRILDCEGSGAGGLWCGMSGMSGMAWHGMAWRGTAQHGTAWDETTRQHGMDTQRDRHGWPC